MRAFASLAALTLILVTVPSVCRAGKVIVLTDDDFDEKTQEGIWLIEAYSPWCHLCRELEDTWERLAEELEGEVYVAKFDVNKEGQLLNRFGVRGVPAIFLLRDGQTREYEGNHMYKKILQFAREGWRDVQPVPFFRAPNSAFGRVYGKGLALPSKAGNYYVYLSKEQGYSDLLLLAVLLAIPISIGLACICALDAYYTRRPGGFPATQHQHQE